MRTAFHQTAILLLDLLVIVTAATALAVTVGCGWVFGTWLLGS